MADVNPAPRGGNSHFATTHWTRILAARGPSPEAQAALRELCEAYYAPVEAFILRTRRGAQDARDLTHEFFARILEGKGFDSLQRDAGRFRSYLLGAIKHFLADQHDRQTAAKRGAGALPCSLNEASVASRTNDDGTLKHEVADPGGFPPDAYFDRDWAIHLLDRVLQTLADEQGRAKKAAEFEVLKPFLTGDSGTHSLSEAAQKLTLSEGAAKVTVHRLRKRFRQLVKDEIATTVATPDEISAEMAYLIEALSHAHANYGEQS